MFKDNANDFSRAGKMINLNYNSCLYNILYVTTHKSPALYFHITMSCELWLVNYEQFKFSFITENNKKSCGFSHQLLD